MVKKLANNDNVEQFVENICKIIITNERKVIKEQDLLKICPESVNFDVIISNVYNNLKKIGFELVKTTFLEEKYYILTTDGKDRDLSPTHYGILALIIALNNELGENLNYFELKNILKEVWENVEFLLDNKYLAQIKTGGQKIIKLTPLGKGVLKNLISEIDLKKFFNLFVTKD